MATLVDSIINISSGPVAFGVAIWGLVVKNVLDKLAVALKIHAVALK